MIKNEIKNSAKWIWTSEWTSQDNDLMGGFVYFRKSFYLDERKCISTIDVSADSRYRLFINGVSVGFGPCKGDKSTWYYDSIDISPYLKEGVNVLAAQVLRYSITSRGNTSVWRTQKPGFYLEGAVTNATGDCLVSLSTNEEWLCLKDKSIKIEQGSYTEALGITETVDGELAPLGWNSIIYNDDTWTKAMTYDIDTSNGVLSHWRLNKRPIPMLTEVQKNFCGVMKITDISSSVEAWSELLKRKKAITIPAFSKIIVDLDAGELTTGFIKLSMSKGKGALIKLLCAECYENESNERPWIRGKAIRDDSEHGVLYGDNDTYKPAGVSKADLYASEVYEPFWFRTFRYVRVEIETTDLPIQLNSIDYRECGYPLEVLGDFQSSNTAYEKFWDISIRTLRRCMHESYEDCPYYEQLQYAMDTRSQILFTYNISGDDRLARKTIYDFHSSLLPQGLTQSRYPSYEGQVIPMFSLYWIFMVYDHMMYYGDKDLIRRYMPTVDSILSYFDRKIDEHGIVGAMSKEYWSFVDWTDAWRSTRGVPTAALYGPITIHSLAYITALHYSAELSLYIGRNGLATEYNERADKISKNVVKSCRSSLGNGMFTDGPGIEEFSQQTQVWAVISEVVKEGEAKKLIQNMLKDTSLPVCSFAMSFYLFRALDKVNLYDKVGDLWIPWQKMVDNHLTTWMEDTVSQRSDCHGWGALPLYEFGSEILGVKPLSPGFSKIKVHPKIGNLTWAKGQVVTSSGIVKVNWECKDNVFMIEINGPEEVPLELCLPNGSILQYNSASNIKYSINY